jgi:hypothetical protein
MSRVDPEFSHRRLSTVKFISGDVDIALFEDLKSRIETLKDPDERLPSDAVQYQEADAWSKVYSWYTRLKKRAAVDRDPAATVKAENAAQTEREWNGFMHERAVFLEWLAREPISADLKAYIGLLPTDLESPVIESGDERFYGARRPDWREISSRMSSASWKLRNMSVLEKARVPDIMAGRRLVDAVNSISDKLKTFEDKLEWLDGRLAAVESKSIDRTKHH